MQDQDHNNQYANTGAMDMPEGFDESRYRVILCAASAYDKKYYFNQSFKDLPQSIQDDLHIICVLFCEEVGGVFTIGFTPDGELMLDTVADEGDLLYDEIGAALLIPKVRKSRADDFRSIEQFYQVKFLHRDPDEVLSDDDDDDEDDTYDSGSGLHGSIGGSDTTFRVSGTPEDFGDSK